MHQWRGRRTSWVGSRTDYETYLSASYWHVVDKKLHAATLAYLHNPSSAVSQPSAGRARRGQPPQPLDKMGALLTRPSGSLA